MTLAGMRKHVGVLEAAGLVVTRKVGRVRTCRIGAQRLDEVTAWIDTYHQLWDERFEERDGRTLVVVSEVYPSKEALDEAGGAEDAMPETFAQLDESLATLL